jgi:tetratricopeptide (TPR) repeat protein
MDKNSFVITVLLTLIFLVWFYYFLDSIASRKKRNFKPDVHQSPINQIQFEYKEIISHFEELRSENDKRWIDEIILVLKHKMNLSKKGINVSDSELEKITELIEIATKWLNEELRLFVENNKFWLNDNLTDKENLLRNIYKRRVVEEFQALKHKKAIVHFRYFQCRKQMAEVSLKELPPFGEILLMKLIYDHDPEYTPDSGEFCHDTYLEMKQILNGEKKEEIDSNNLHVFEMFSSANDLQNEGKHNQAIDFYLMILNRFNSEKLTIQDNAIVEATFEPQNKGEWIEINEFTPIASVYFNLGLSYWNLNEIQKALEVWDAAITYEGKLYPEFYHYRGTAKLKLKDWSCIDDFTAAIKISPEYYASYFNRAVAYSDSECDLTDLKLAQDDLKIYLNKYPKDNAAKNLLSLISN